MNSRKERQSPNKQLVPLVRQDYITKAGGLFEAQFAAGNRTSDLSSIYPAMQTSMADSRLEFSRFLAGIGRKSYVKTENAELFQKSRHFDGRIERKMLGNQTFDRQLLEMHFLNDGHRESVERSGYQSRQRTDSRQHRDIIQHIDYSSSSRSSSVEKEVDISTYIREQRKLIKRVKSGSKVPSSKNLKDSSVLYEIKEFKRPFQGDSWRGAFTGGQQSKAELTVMGKDGTQDKFMRQFNSGKGLILKTSPLMEDTLSTGYKTSAAGKNTQFKTYDDRESLRNSVADFEVSQLRDRLQFGRSNRDLSQGAKDHALGLIVIKRAHPTTTRAFEDVLREDNEYVPKPQQGNISEDNTQASVGQRYSRTPAETKGKLWFTRDLSKKQSLDRLSVKFNRCNTSVGLERNEVSENSLEPSSKLSTKQINLKSSEALFVGDSDQNQSLAAHFRKKLGKSDCIKFFQKPNRSNQGSPAKQSPKAGDTSKIDLRKKMMDYGKNVSRSKQPRRGTELSESRENLNLTKVSSNPNLLSIGHRKASPKPEVLERLARGIKPKVEKSEIHEITRRHIEKFQKLSKLVETPNTNLAKKAELIERRNKVKELDMVSCYDDRK